MAEATMNKNTPVLRAGAVIAAEPGLESVPLRAWRWIAVGQLCMLAAFAGLSLVVIALSSAFHSGSGHGLAALLATAGAGVLLMVLAWKGMARMLRHLERDGPSDPEPGARRHPGDARLGGASARAGARRLSRPAAIEPTLILF